MVRTLEEAFARIEELENDKYEDGMSVAGIVETGNISRRTAYRYKKYYDSLVEKNEISR